MLGAVLGRGTDSDQPPVIVGAPAAAGEATTAGAPGATAGGTRGRGGRGRRRRRRRRSGRRVGVGVQGRGRVLRVGLLGRRFRLLGRGAATSAPTPSTQDFVKKSKKLPDKVGTGGKPPPKDKAAPGGGSEGTTIG